jgi:glycosyltransferase involved in cell wall biosynthesis
VASNSGWFSDRSACYLASGRPVVAQDTGFGRRLPTGEGLLAFSTVEEAVEALEQVNADYDRHAAAARRIAVDELDSANVLGDLLDHAGVGCG